MSPTITTERKLKPFLKWAGGKGQLIPSLLANLPPNWNPKENYYYEPFLGGGALLFELQPRWAIAGDINPELVNCYECVEFYLEALITELSKYEVSKEYYLAVRNLEGNGWAEPTTNVGRAAKFIYLNKTCYRGLQRVNSQGQFNTPYGNYKSVDYGIENLRSLSRYMKANQFVVRNSDWRAVVSTASKGDFVYLDPPYDPVSKTSSFTAYSVDKFGRDEQIELKAAIDYLTKEGVYVMQSNAATPFILDLYQSYRKTTVDAHRAINNSKGTRAKVQEVIITNYKP